MTTCTKNTDIPKNLTWLTKWRGHIGVSVYDFASATSGSVLMPSTRLPRAPLPRETIERCFQTMQYLADSAIKGTIGIYRFYYIYLRKTCDQYFSKGHTSIVKHLKEKSLNDVTVM